MSRFRLAARPGLVRANNHIRTVVAPNLDVHINVPHHPIPSPPQARVIAPTLPGVQPPQPPPKITPLSRATPRNADIRRTVVNVRQTALNNRRDNNDNSEIRDKILSIRGIGRGRILILVACGPSIKEVTLERLKNVEFIDIMSVNKPDIRLCPTTYWIFCDQTQHDRNVEMFNSYTGTLINAATIGVRHPNQILIKVLQGKGFSKNLCLGFHIGRSTTYAALQVAAWMNYDKVFIFGCDMSAVSGQMHFYGKNPDVTDEIRQQRFKMEAEHYSYSTQILSDDERQRYVFCSTYNQFEFINKFQRMSQVEAVDNILNLAEKMRGNYGKVG